MKENNETERQDYVRRYLPDDAWLVSHILEFVVATLCNVQTNAHHPDDAASSQCYALKYQMMGERQVSLVMRNVFDDPVVEYFKMQVGSRTFT